MRRYLILAAAALPLIAAAPAVAAPIIQYNFTGQPGNETSVAATVPAGVSGITGLSFTRGPGLIATTTTNNSITSTGWSTNADDYYDFGLNVIAGNSATVTDLMFGSQSSSSGPGFINVLASVDGGAFATVGSYALTAGTQLSQTLTLTTSLTALRSIDFRLVAANGTPASGSGSIASGGTFRINNYDLSGANTPFAIDGTVTPAATSPVPEPASWAMMIVGAGLVGGAMRRRSRSTRVAFAA